jgi:hypothetical protein
MFDKFEPFQGIQKQDFAFQPTRFEIWIGGKMFANGRTNSIIYAKVIKIDDKEKMEVICDNGQLNRELADKNIFDEFITATDRLQLITIPNETNSENMAIMMFKMNIGATRDSKNFNRNEPYCCSLFMQNGRIAKITFSYSNPEKLLEFYSEQERQTSIDLDFVFKSSDHIRYENGRHVSGPHGGAGRAIKVEPNISGGEGVSVTTYNLDGNHPIWQNNVQIAPKQMKVIQQTNDTIVLRGYGYDAMGASFADYGLTIKLNNGELEKCILHLHDRAVDIEYLP